MAKEPSTSKVYRGHGWPSTRLSGESPWKSTVWIAMVTALGVLITELVILAFTWKDIVNWIVFHY